MLNKMIVGMLPYMPKSSVWLFSKRYVAGETVDDAVRACRELNAGGIKITLDLLGEFISDLAEAERNKQEYLRIIERVQGEKLDGNYSLKPTSFGLLLDKEVCYRHIREIVAKAASYGSFVRVDMEDSSCTSSEIEIFRRLKAEFPKNVGLVLQAYLRRTLKDIEDMRGLNAPGVPVNFRLCKGIYVEPESVAFKDHDEVNRHYLEDLEAMLKYGMYPAIATHDKALVQGAFALLEKYRLPRASYEFQMLYGVTPELRRTILEKGHPMRVYVPFGRQWFGYCSRRLKENPKIASQVIKALFVRG